MQLLLFVVSAAAVALLGMVLLVPWLERLSWKRDFVCPMPTPEAPRQTPAVDPAPHRNPPEPTHSLASRAANP